MLFLTEAVQRVCSCITQVWHSEFVME